MPYVLINLIQTKEERQAKYHLARSLGINSYLAREMRDWRISKIERWAGLQVIVEHRQLSPVGQFLLPGWTEAYRQASYSPTLTPNGYRVYTLPEDNELMPTIK